MDYQHRPALPTAFALLVDCCARSFASVARRIAPVDDPAVWTDFLDQSRRHRVQGIAWRGLKSGQIEPPEAIGAALADDARAIAMGGLGAADRAAALNAAMASAGVDHLFVKGLTLSALAYGDAFLKMSNDVDILVAPSDIAEAGAVLDAEGFRMVEPANRPLVAWHAANKESVWLGRDGTIVELHSRLADNERLIPGIGMASPRQEVMIGPGIALPTLADEHLAIYLAVHGASSVWFRLKWIADFAALIERWSPDDIQRIAADAEEIGAGRTFAQALLLATTLFGTELGGRLDRIVNTRANHAFIRLALGELTNRREPLDRPMGTAAIHAAQLLAAPGAGFALSEIARQTRHALRRR